MVSSAQFTFLTFTLQSLVFQSMHGVPSRSEHAGVGRLRAGCSRAAGPVLLDLRACVEAGAHTAPVGMRDVGSANRSAEGCVGADGYHPRLAGGDLALCLGYTLLYDRNTGLAVVRTQFGTGTLLILIECKSIRTAS